MSRVECDVNTEKVSRWRALGDGENLYDVLSDNNGINEAATLKSEELVDEREKASEILEQGMRSKDFNSVSVSTVFDVLSIRIPQLISQCQSHYKILKTCFSTMDHGFVDPNDVTNLDSIWGKDLKVVINQCSDDCPTVKYPTLADIEKHCTFVAESVNTTNDALCGTSEDTVAEVALRLKASVSGIQGWKNAIVFNEKLKQGAKNMNIQQLSPSPLLKRQQTLDLGDPEVPVQEMVEEDQKNLQAELNRLYIPGKTGTESQSNDDAKGINVEDPGEPSEGVEPPEVDQSSIVNLENPILPTEKENGAANEAGSQIPENQLGIKFTNLRGGFVPRESRNEEENESSVIGITGLISFHEDI